MKALPAFLPLLLGFAALVAAVYIAGLMRLWRAGGASRFWRIVACLALPTTFLLVTGLVSHFRVLGRHLAPLLPVLLFVGATGVRALWKQGSGGRIVVGLFLGFSIVSCLQIRLAARHGLPEAVADAVLVVARAFVLVDEGPHTIADRLVFGAQGEIDGHGTLLVGDPRR